MTLLGVGSRVLAPSNFTVCVNHKLALAIGTGHLPLQELNHVLLLAADLQHPTEGVQGGELE